MGEGSCTNMGETYTDLDTFKAQVLCGVDIAQLL